MFSPTATKLKTHTQPEQSAAERRKTVQSAVLVHTRRPLPAAADWVGRVAGTRQVAWVHRSSRGIRRWDTPSGRSLPPPGEADDITIPVRQAVSLVNETGRSGAHEEQTIADLIDGSLHEPNSR